MRHFTGWLLLLWPMLAWGGLLHDSELHWQTRASAHFRIHYHDGGEAMAERALSIAERVHAELAPRFDWEPDRPTELVLADESDDSNGSSTPIPHNRITLYPAAPDDAMSLEDHADWLETLIRHEYVHTLHMDKARGTPLWLRDHLFGRHYLLFPNIWQPRWLIEGLATWQETDTTRGIGRGQSSYYAMMMRMEVAAGIKPLRQVNQPLASWPMGTTPYLYGVHFYRFLAEKYGPRTAWRLVANFSDNIIPFRIGAAMHQETGRTIDELWKEFGRWLHEQYPPDRDGMELAGEALTRDGYLHASPVAAEDGRLWLVAYTAHQGGRIVRFDPASGEQRAIADAEPNARLDFHPEHGLLLAQSELCRNARSAFDLWRVDPESGDATRLTHCARYRSATWLPDGKIVAVHNEFDRNALDLLDGEGKLLRRLWTGEAEVVVGPPSAAPDGRALIASLWRPGRGWDLEQFDLATAIWRQLTHDAAIEMQPRYSRDGTSLLYSADYGGIYDIRRMQLSDGSISTLTQVAGGAFAPAEAGVQGLYYVGYSARGFDLFHLPQAGQLPTAAAAAGPSAIALPPPPKVATHAEGDYAATASGLAPTFWFPYFSIAGAQSEIGLSTFGSDTLERHNYTLLAAIDAKNGWPIGYLDYRYDRWLPYFRLYGHQFGLPQRTPAGQVSELRLQRQLDLELVLPWLSNDFDLSLHLGGSMQRNRSGRALAPFAAQPQLRDDVVGAALNFDSAERFPQSISLTEGRKLLLLAEESGRVGASDFSGRVYGGSWNEYLPLAGAHVLAVQLAAGWGVGNTRPFTLGGVWAGGYLQGLSETLAVGTPFNRRAHSLRGYAAGQPQLAGKRMQTGSLEYRFPLGLIERGFMAPPLGLHQLHGALFADAGAAWNVGKKTGRYKVGVGSEFTADTVLFYNLLLQLSAGYAYGIDRQLGGHQLYLRLGTSF